MPQKCPHCGKPLKDTEDRGRKSAEPTPETTMEQPRETDHRGIALPRRTRVGGIIMPQ
jgi:hypothetical protein